MPGDHPLGEVGKASAVESKKGLTDPGAVKSWPGGRSLASERARRLLGGDDGAPGAGDDVQISGGGKGDYDEGRREIMRQLLDTALGAGGMASVGAIGSIVSWADAELEQAGQLHPETAEIVREALERAAEYGILTEEQVADLTEHFFPEGS